MPPDLRFSPLRAEDLPRLHRWLVAPHVARWFGGPRTLEDVREQYLPSVESPGPAGSSAHVVSLGERPIGMCEWMRFDDFPDAKARYRVEDPGASNIDVLLGERDVAYRGLGVAVIEAYLERVVFAAPGVSLCVIDPIPENFSAIRCYEKVGFRFVRALPEDGEGNGLYLMELRREELGRARAAPPFHVRPARPDEAALAEELDDDASRAFEALGVGFDDVDPGFHAAEAALWAEAAREGRMLFACAPSGEPVGFASLGFVDGEPHLQQVSVRPGWARRGIGRALVERALRWSVRPGVLWLTTYDGVPWNRPFYERLGFEVAPVEQAPPALQAIAAAERRALPLPERRVVMRWRRAPGGA